MDARALQTALDVLGPEGNGIAIWSRAALRSDSRRVLRRRMPDDPSEAARQLFAVLHEFDAAGVRLIWIEPPPEGPEWAGIHDRLRRAAASV